MKIHSATIKLLAAVIAVALASCGGGKKSGNTMEFIDTDSVVATADSTLYGVCGDETTMHVLQLVQDKGDTLSLLVDADEPTNVLGGILAGDRMAAIAQRNADGELLATTVINLTTLQGRWTSIDKNFDIKEGGVVKSSQKAETNPWVSWKISNGRLVFNDRDTFAITTLGADSLYLENNEGIFAYKRWK